MKQNRSRRINTLLSTRAFVPPPPLSVPIKAFVLSTLHPTTYSLAETYDWPEGAAKTATAAEAATNQPLHVHGQCLLQDTVDPGQCRFELLRSDS